MSGVRGAGSSLHLTRSLGVLAGRGVCRQQQGWGQQHKCDSCSESLHPVLTLLKGFFALAGSLLLGRLNLKEVLEE